MCRGLLSVSLTSYTYYMYNKEIKGMVRNISKLLGLLLVLVLTASCSDNAKMKGLLEQIPASSDLVVVGNLKTIVESAGGTIEKSQFKIPANVSDLLPSGLDDVNDFLKTSGIDVEACALVGDYKSNKQVFVFALNDKDKFIEAIEDLKFREKNTEGDAAIYAKKVYESTYSEGNDDYGYIAVNGSYAYWIERVWEGSEFKPVRYLQKMIEDAKDKSFAESECAEYIMDGNAFGMCAQFPKALRQQMRQSGVSSDMVSLVEGSICLRCNLSANKCTVDIKLFDEDGNAVSGDMFKKFMDVSSTISDDALALLGSNECVILAESLKGFDWEKYFGDFATAANMSRSDRADLDAMVSYFEQIDGTVAFGFGLTNGLESAADMANGNSIMSQFSATMVVETKDGKAKRLVDDLRGLLENAGSVQPVTTSSGFSVQLNDADGSTFYVEHKGNCVVIANHPIKDKNDNAVVKKAGLSQYLAAIYIGLYKGNKLFEDLKLKDNMSIGFYCKPNTLDASLTFEIDGDSGTGILAKITKVILDIMPLSNELEQKFDPYESYDSYDYYDYDSVAVDTDVVSDYSEDYYWEDDEDYE